MKTKIIALAIGSICLSLHAADNAKIKFTENFDVDKSELSSVGTNDFFILAPGYQLVLEGKEDGKATVLTITVLNETKMVDGVETRIIEENESVDGKPIEISRNYFAISKRTSDVFYFGEDVDMYKDGKVTSHEGGWQSGVDGAHFGLEMSAMPLLGARYYQEIAPKSAMDRAEVVSITESFKTPAGKFEKCLKTEETSALEKGTEYKIYARGIGLINEGELKLKKHGFVSK
ncbi:MAG: hypothetical protein ABI042_13735 [Verrucomicrobiota bacterium]